jgi:regulator of protease activity HflC (stomatin/prohibitin superfamily)
LQVFTFDELLSLIARITWLLYLLYVVLSYIFTARSYGLTIALIRLASVRVLAPILLPITIGLLSLAVVFVQPQQIAIVVSILTPGGIRPQPLLPGLHVIVPVLENEVQYPMYWQTYTMASRPTEGAKLGDDSIRARTRDGQEVRLDSSLIFRIDPGQVVSLHTDWQTRYIDDLVRPVVRGVVRTQVSQFTVREVNSDARQDLEATLDRLLTEQLGDKGLIVDQFLLRDISFTPEYAAAIERKQVALEGEEQAAHEAEQVRQRAQGQRDRLMLEADGRAQAILREAEAQSQALKLIADSLAQNKDLVTYHYVDKLAPNIRVMLVPNTSPLILPLSELDATNAMSNTGATAITPPNTITATMPMTPTMTPMPRQQN